MSENAASPALRERMLQLLDRVPFARLLGIELNEIKPGFAVLSVDIRPELMQNHGVVHGGVIASLADTAAAFAIASILKPEESTTTIDLTIHYLRPLTSGTAIATATILREGQRVIVLTVEVKDQREKVLATTTAAFLRSQGTPG
jgi:uncharacterized protein (TIGR00369 family)